MTLIRSTINGRTANVSQRLAKQLVSGGKYTYATSDMSPEPPSVPKVQPTVVAAKPITPAAPVTPGTDISPITGKPKRQYRRRAAQPTGEEE